MMVDLNIISKDEDNQTPTPIPWRRTFSEIVKAFVEKDYELKRGVNGVDPIPVHRAVMIANNIEAYGAQLTSLQEGSWNTSVMQWMINFWEVLIDLNTLEEGASDLALSVRVYEEGLSYRFKVYLVYVP
jgi:hypothetical protein